MKCRDCGVEFAPFEQEIDASVDQVLTTSLEDAKTKSRVCPLCGHSKAVPFSQKRSVLFVLLVAILFIFGVVIALLWRRIQTDRSGVVRAAISHMRNNAYVARIIGTPIKTGSAIEGALNRGETGEVPQARFDGTFPCVSAAVHGGSISTTMGKCAMPATHTGVSDRFETDLRSGSFVLRQTDLQLTDVFDVPLTRSYRSDEWTSPNPVHAFGRNSNHPYDIAPLGTRNPYTYQMLVLEDGDFLYFDRISKGTGYADAAFMHTETSTRFYKATQRWNGDGWTMKLADGSEILFPEAYNARNLAQGAATEMRDAKGNRLELIRDGQRNLQEIRTPNGHWIKFNYDGLSRINRAVTDTGAWAQYEYNPDGMLVNVTTSSGRRRHYEYDGALMTQISDESGHVLVRNWYEKNILKKQQFADGTTYSYRYDWPSNSYYPAKVWVTLSDGATKELSVADSVPEFIRNYHRH